MSSFRPTDPPWRRGRAIGNETFYWDGLKAGFHQRRSRSRSRSHKRAYNLVKMENRSRKQSHKLDGIGVGRIRTFPFLPIPFTTSSLMIQWKLGCRSRKQKRKNQPIAKSGIEHCHWFPLLLATPTMQFSLDRKQHRRRISVLLPTPSVSFSLDRIALPFWLRLRLRLRR